MYDDAVNRMVREFPVADLDAESAAWVRSLSGTGPQREDALTRLHELLVRIALADAGRRGPRHRITGPELEDLAYQAAADALLAITAKLGQFRGESQFTTWAYKFVIFEVSAKLGRHFWRQPNVPFVAEDWDRLPDRFGFEPEREAERRELVAALRGAVDDELTERQRQVFLAVVVHGVPLDAVVAELGSNRNAIYKMMFDARRKLRAELVANGYLGHDTMGGDHERLAGTGALPADRPARRRLRRSHGDAGRLRELVTQGDTAQERYPGIAAHLRACGPCGEDFDGLLAALRDPA